MRNYAEEIKEQLSIVDIVGGYVKLEKAGKNWRARCPFHNEKTPSFYVSSDRGTFTCFGCGAKGDMFSFVEKFEGVDFKGALQTLALRAGIDMKERGGSSEDKDQKERLYRMLEEATKFFESEYKKSEEAAAYLEKRGVKNETVRDMRIGYAPLEWRLLRSHLLAKKYSDDELVSAGLVKRTDAKGKEPYDVFRGRIMFPISDPSGRVVAFSGRILKDDPKAPKYLNSPETVLYSKTKVLYGLDKAKQAIRTADYAILVEGQMDLVMSRQAGLKNTVAVSGTALTDELERRGDMTGLGLISRLSKNLIVAFDSDSAGVKAALRAARIGLVSGLDVKIAYPEGGKDPADIIKEDPKAWADAIRKAKNSVEFSLDRILDKKADLKHMGALVRSDVLPMVSLIESAIEQSRLIEIISIKTGIKSDALWKDLARIEPERISVKPEATIEPRQISKLDRLTRSAFGIMFSEKSSGTDFGKRLYDAVGKDMYASYIALSPTETSSLATESEILYGEHGPGEKLRTELLQNISKERLKMRREEIRRDLQMLEKEGKNTDALLKEYVELSKKINS